MLPLVILVGTPALAGTCFVMWDQGQQLVLTRQEDPPQQTAISYASGLLAVAGAYGAQGYAIRTLEGGEGGEVVAQAQKNKGRSASTTIFKPPQNMGEFFGRVGRPLLLHFGAISVAFACAGAVQTMVAKLSSDRKTSIQNIGRP